MEVQPHGGALLREKAANHVPGPGRPPSALRERLRGSFADRIKVLEDVSDGHTIQRADVPLLTVLKYAHCPKCGDKLKPNADLDPADALLLTIEGMVSASVNDRLKALDIAAKYGLGTLKEVSTEQVRDRLRETIAIIKELVPDQAEAVLAKLQPVWR